MLKKGLVFLGKKFALVTLCLTLILVFSTYGKSETAVPSAKEKSEKPLIKLRAAFNKNGGQTPQYVADKIGFFRKHGLQVERIEFRDNSKMVGALQSGDLDIIASIPAVIFFAREQGYDLIAFMQNETAKMEAPDSGAILIHKDSGINSLKDLSGKKIAVLSKSSQAAIDAMYLLKKAGVDLNTLTLISAPFASHFDLLKSRQVDASVSVDPFTTRIKESGIGKVLLYQYIETVPGQPLGAWWASRNWVNKNPKVVEAFSLAIKDAIDYLHADDQRARQMVADYTGLDKQLVDKMPMINWNYKVDLDAWQKENQIIVEMGTLKKMPDPDDYFADYIKKYFVSKK